MAKTPENAFLAENSLLRHQISFHRCSLIFINFITHRTETVFCENLDLYDEKIRRCNLNFEKISVAIFYSEYMLNWSRQLHFHQPSRCKKTCEATNRLFHSSVDIKLVPKVFLCWQNTRLTVFRFQKITFLTYQNCSSIEAQFIFSHAFNFLIPHSVRGSVLHRFARFNAACPWNFINISLASFESANL